MEFRRDDAAEDFRRAADVVDLEKRAAILGGSRKLPGPSLSEDIMVSLSQLAMIATYVRALKTKVKQRGGDRSDLDDWWLVSQLRRPSLTDAACLVSGASLLALRVTRPSAPHAPFGSVSLSELLFRVTDEERVIRV